MDATVVNTPRLKIRRIRPGDYEAMMSVYGDLELMRFVGDGSAITAEDCARWIDITLDNYSKRGYGLFLMESASDGSLAGFIGLTHTGGQPEPEIKYVLRQPLWGQGLASEAVDALCTHARSTWGLTQVIATVAPENTASHRVLAKCGFSRWEDLHNEDGSTTAVWRLA
ncbi:MAG: GNAT family N-acetyltransferase [Armatimonadetes bacterium]|nr:GNAT family N-acetyltransferase [Armatimonadota bacterium]